MPAPDWAGSRGNDSVGCFGAGGGESSKKEMVELVMVT